MRNKKHNNKISYQTKQSNTIVIKVVPGDSAIVRSSGAPLGTKRYIVLIIFIGYIKERDLYASQATYKT